MKKSQLASYSIALLLSGLIFGCSTSDRIEEKTRTIENPQDQNQTPNSGGTFINDDTDIGGGNVVSDENSTTGTIKIDAKNAYKVTASFSEEYNKKGYYSREEIGSINFNIVNIYTNQSIDTSKVESIVLQAEEQIDENITDTDGNIDTVKSGKYFNFITYDGKEGPTYRIPSESVKGSDTVAIKIKKLSGTTNLILSVNLVGFDKPYKLKVPLVIEKNKSSSMAIVPIGSRYENGLFIDKFVIHVVDSYGNKAADGTNISTGVINNPKLYSNAYNGAIISIADHDTIESNETQTFTHIDLDDQTPPYSSKGIINHDWGSYKVRTTTTSIDENNNTIYNYKITNRYYTNIITNPIKNHRGKLNKTDGTFSLNIDSDRISSEITDKDTLIILANKENHKPENLGGWDIQSVLSDDRLSLVNLDFSTENIENVSYVIGDEYRYIDNAQTIANGAVSTFETTAVKDGIAYAELRYTPEMVGHNVFIYANTKLEDKHIGISRKVLLHGTGLSEQTLSCTNDKGLRPNCSRLIRIVQNDSGKGAYKVNIARPQIVGEQTFMYATATQTSATGWTNVSIYGIDENKTATVSFGSLINDEFIINTK